MRTETRPRQWMLKVSNLLLTPAYWLERAKGRKRLALGGAYILIVLLVGVLGWRATSLWRLPDVGEPFDRTAFLAVSVPDDENAFTLYRQSGARLKHLNEGQKRLAFNLDWSKTDPSIQRWVEENREALDLYRRGSDRSRALYVHPRDFTFETPLPVVQDIRDMARLAALQGSRHQEAGDMASAWTCLRANLRASRLVAMRGSVIQRLVATAVLRFTSPRVTAWAADPRVDATQLRRALADMAACKAMSPPISEALEVEYLCVDRALDTPARWLADSRKNDFDWFHHLPGTVTAALFFKREPERSRRLARLVFANWLAYCDRPAGDRPMFVTEDPKLYAVDPGAPAAARALAPQAIERWMKSTLVLSEFLPALPDLVYALGGDVPLLETLEIHLAEQCYEREHGKVPESPALLVGPYLKQLPARYREPAASTGSARPAAPVRAQRP